MDRQSTHSHWNIIRPVQKQIYWAMILSVIATCCSLASIYWLALMIQSVYSETDLNSTQYFLAATGCAIAAYLLRGIAFKGSHLAAFSLESTLRRQLSQRLVEVPLGTLGEQGSAALTKVIQDDVRDLHAFVADATPLYARAYATPVLTFMLLLWIDWRLALVALAVLVVGMAILGSVMKDAGAMHEQYNAAREKVNQAVIEFVQAMPVVRTFDGGQTSFGRYQKALDHYLKYLISWYRTSGPPARLSMIILSPLPTLLVLMWWGSYGLWQEHLSFSVWVACLLLGTGMAEALMPYMALYHLIEKAKISISRIHQVLNLPKLQQTSDPHKPHSSEIIFEDVSFRYQSRANNALSNVSFTVPAGSFTALVGPSGSGKSTVARLIQRFWDVSSGRVLIGGVDVRHIATDTLMQHISFVFQDAFLFSGSVIDNIRLGQEDKSKQQVIEAAKAAQAHDFIQALPQGYDSQVGECGANLSGGQRQRLTIARAFLQDRPILILDEATAFTDAENETLLIKALNQLMAGKTVLMIAHRLATIRHSDQVLVFSNGCLTETGTPDELLTRTGIFSDLWHDYQQAQNWRIDPKVSTEQPS